MGEFDLLRFGVHRVRVGPWRSTDDVAYVSPLADIAVPTYPVVSHITEVLRERGYRSAVTAALAENEVNGFVQAGFAIRERLHLLRHDMADVHRRPIGATRRARKGDHAAVLAVDERSFRPFWRLDESGLREALSATPVSRFRVTGPARRLGGGPVTGYAIFGRAGNRGYLQRLAVDPDHQGGGLGRILVADGLAWLARRSVRSVVVNTQESNADALALYERMGFARQPDGLVVLEASFDQPVR